MGRTKLLWITDLSETGYTNASRTLIQYLIENQEMMDMYEIFIYGINHAFDNQGMERFYTETLSWFPKDHLYWSDNTKFLLNYMPATSKYMQDPFFRSAVIDQRTGIYDMERVLKAVRPDIVLTINDNGVLMAQNEVLRQIGLKYPEIRPKKVAYMPIDCYDFPDKFFDGLRDYDVLITMTEFGKKEIEKTGYPKPVHILNHSIDNRTFRPLENKKELREKWLPIQLRNRFVILNSNKNQNRKRLDITIQAYKLLIDRGIKVGLVLKTSKSPSMNNGGLDMEKVLNEMEPIYKNYIHLMERRLTLNELNELYNAIDVNINTSIGEGWGIVPCEVALCGIPQLVPHSTSYPEIFGHECLVKCDPALRLVAMNDAKIEPTSLQTILKGIIRPVEWEVSEKAPAEITLVPGMMACPESNIFTIMISEQFSKQQVEAGQYFGLNNGLIVRKVASKAEGICNWLYENRNQIQAFQIVCQNGTNMRELRDATNEITKELLKLSSVYKLVMMNPDDVCRMIVRADMPNAVAFADKIEALCKYPALAEKIGRNCRGNIINRFNIERVGEKLANILKSIADNN